MKTAELERFLVFGDYAPFSYRRYIVVSNVSWGFLYQGEADLLAISGSGYLTEVELKVSVSDLKRDIDKEKHRHWMTEHSKVKRFYYAMPSEVWAKFRGILPAHAGIIIVDPEAKSSYSRARTIIRAKPSSLAQPLNVADKMKLMRLGCMRYWARKEGQVNGR